MELPRLSDGVVTLRAPEGAEAEALVGRLRDRGRGSTDLTGGLEANALAAAGGLLVEVDRQVIGDALLHRDGKGTGRLILQLGEAGQERAWIQGLGHHCLRLLIQAAFEQFKVQELRSHGIDEAALAAHAWADVGFGMQRRQLVDQRVLCDLLLPRVCHQAHEQRVLLIRHGRSGDGAPARLPAGDPPLDHIGRAQAEALVLSPLVRHLDEAICGPSLRCRGTADAAFAHHGTPCAVDEAWAERDWGAWRGRAVAELSRDDEGRLQDPPEGEAIDACDRRLRRALDSLPHGVAVAVITHGFGIARLLHQLAPGLAEAPGLGSGDGLGHAAITELRRGPAGWRVLRISDDRHLQARRATAELA